MAFGGIFAHQQHLRGRVKVIVAGRTIAAEAAFIAGHRDAHAQPRIGIKVITNQGALQPLGGQVIVVTQKLARAVNGDDLGAPDYQGGADADDQQVELPHTGERRVRLIGELAPQRRGRPVAMQGFAHRGALHAHLAQRRRMLVVATGGPGITAGGAGAIAAGRRSENLATAHTAAGALGQGGL